MHRKKPNEKTYRPFLGADVNRALFELADKRNKNALEPIEYNDWLIKAIAHWYRNEFPDRKLPFETKMYIEDLDL